MNSVLAGFYTLLLRSLKTWYIWVDGVFAYQSLSQL